MQDKTCDVLVYGKGLPERCGAPSVAFIVSSDVRSHYCLNDLHLAHKSGHVVFPLIGADE